ncbi:hypothetical protein PPYR_13697 [Photinus pyralis]|uniref:UBA domain-containing protein n=1 Tax=Photinus pyralis TaxID=7054 RepID=A0A5N4A9T8_PHOPY|nr:protein Gawky isoform X2 [Photinus pyralis]KAB0794077.1 hypothetical protein PPYR_13697 [Photinus pyralis]
MRDPAPSEPKFTFPTFEVPQASAMRGRAPPVQVARAAGEDRACLPSTPFASLGAYSVINGSSCPTGGNSNLRMQSVTDNCLLNSVTVPKIQRNDHTAVAHNNSDKLESKFGALQFLFGQDIPNEKSENLNGDLIELNLTKNNTSSNCNSNATDESYSLERLIRLSQRTRELERLGYALPLRLCGGGESSLSTGTSGWGSPPSQPASNTNANSSTGWGNANAANANSTGTQQWSNSNRATNAGPGPQPQDGNKSIPNLQQNGQQPATSQSNNPGWGPGNKPAVSNTTNPVSTSQPSVANPPHPTNSTKQQLEQLNNMREAIFSHDGWGGHINQDTNWDIPGSPEPLMKIDGGGTAPPWKPNINNGTELWEANLRNGGQPPPQPQQKPWGHTPATNIGGTWGEDDDAADSSNVWTGVPATQQQWGNNATTGAGTGGTGGGAMWGAPKKETEWATATAAGWGDPRSADPRTTGMDLRDMRPDLRDIRSNNTDPMRMLDPREQMRLTGGDMRGDPRGITGRLNGAGAEAFWAQAGPQASAHHMHHQGKIPMVPGGGNPAGWEEPSPPAQRRTMPNYDDGTSLWGNPQQGSHWKDLPTTANMARGAGGPPGMPQARMKPDGSVWSHGRNGSWDESGPAWDDSNAPWGKQKPMVGGPLWENEIDWNHKQGPKPALSKEMVWNSKQFRVLVDMGYKKDDVETALRNRDMNMEDALDMLSSVRGGNIDSWRTRHEDHYDHQGAAPFPGQRFPNGPSGQMPFPPGNNAPNLLSSMGSGSTSNNCSINNITKMIPQSGGNQSFGSTSSGRTIPPQSTPTSHQLRLLVQQIQMAVQAGYLNHQILNQPLAPQTLVLLNQLLQQIKNLQQLLTQQSVAQSQTLGGKPSNILLQCSVLITKTKQQISNLQNQIAAQQAIYVKQQQHNLTGNSSGGPSDIFKTNPMHDSINALQGNFVDLGIKDSQISQQQSRLNQWKLPALDKEEGGEFSRAPGSISKPLAPSNSSPNLNGLGLTQPDGPWSSGRSADTGGWPDAGANDPVADNKDGQWSTSTQPSLTDLVPEFEPGKPWKGNQMKSIEDDPSITPGSVVRSPLSIATIKDTELFNMNSSKNSPPGGDSIQPLSLSSSTWSFNPPATTPSAFTSPQNKLPASKGSLGDPNPSTAVTSELWGAPKSRGPPPGLATKGASGLNGWTISLGSASWAAQRSSGNWGSSPWLLLRNLTAQIDGSTLRTLCMQHGPLQSFHLYLHQGFALAKYSSREEATKAQTALNNCVLGNTTILAENPTDWEAQSLLQQVASQGGSSGGWRSTNKQPATAGDTWSTGWPNNPSTTSLWGSGTLDNSDQSRATPSSLNSFLPGDLLGSGESM